MMVPVRHRQAEQGLEQAVDVGGGEEVAPARDQRNAVGCVVDRGGKMVARRSIAVLAHQHDIAKPRRVGLLHARALVGPAQRPGPRESSRDVKPPRDRIARVDRTALAGPGIDRAFGADGRSGRGDFRPGAGAGIDQPFGPQPVGGRGIALQPGRLRCDLIPFQPEPRQIGTKLVGKLRPTARAIDVLESEQEASAAVAGQIVRDNGRESVPEVQGTVRTGGESGDDQRRSPWRECRESGKKLVDSILVTVLTRFAASAPFRRIREDTRKCSRPN